MEDMADIPVFRRERATSRHRRWPEGNNLASDCKIRIPSVLFNHHLQGDPSNFSKLLGGVAAQGLTPYPSLDSRQQ
jgi:hypothetical protein